MLNEQWKKVIVENQETNYLVSSLGSIKNTKTGKTLKGTYGRNEYHSVQLSINGKLKSFMTHRLVASAFCSNPNNYLIVDHIDRNKHNNRATNLRWVTDPMNVRNAIIDNSGSSDEYWQGDIDDLAEVKTSDGKYKVSTEGIFVNANTKRILKGSPRNGYIRINIKNKVYSAHRLIWEAFNGPIPEEKVVDHINGNRSDNRLENLRLVTQSENVENGYRNGYSAKKKIYQYSLDGNFIAVFDRLHQATEITKTSAPAISSAAKRKGTCGWFIWSFTKLSNEEIYEIIEKNKVRSDANGITRYDINGLNLKHYRSISEAAKDIKCPVSTISRGVKTGRKAKGYYWILDSEKNKITIEQILNK